MHWKLLTLLIILGSLLTASAFVSGFWWASGWPAYSELMRQQALHTQVPEPTPTPLPYLAYSIPALRTYPFKASQVVLEKELTTTDTYTSYQFSFTTAGKLMTGQIHIPTGAPALENSTQAGYPVILMARGWAPEETYVTGTGTQPAARYFAEHGFVTLAPDFFGFGESDPAQEDSWIDRFTKPIAIIELLRSVQEHSVITPGASASVSATLLKLDSTKIAFWGHSNGGQIMLSTLEITGKPIPTTLWAPVTAPFPYSLLYFSDESEDEGKEMRKWISIFEKNYDVFDFSVTKNLDTFVAPLQIQHGTADTSALIDWSDNFRNLIDIENTNRQTLAATSSATAESTLPEIKLEYFRYPGVDHNMRPRWDDAVAQDVRFFSQELQ